MRKYLFVVLVFFLSGSSDSLWAYPIFPQTLSDLYKGADHVAYGKVVGFIPLEEEYDVTKPPSLYNTWVQVVIQEELKGELIEKEICIAHYLGMMCPEPFDFREGQEVLLFLNKDIREHFYWPYSWSYGAREVDADAYCLYKEKLIGLQAVLAISNPERQEQQYVTWIVDCIKEPLTRWDGVFDLLNEKVDHTPERNLVAHPYSITAEQNQVVRQIIFDKNKINVMDLRVLNYLKYEQDKEILNFVSKQLKQASLKDEGFLFFQLGSRIIAALSDRQDLKDLVLTIDENEVSREVKQKLLDFQEKI
ncbi:hypothetical protein [Myroides sp. DW712]|uniref:hypothetical protein n=1 Tax=Myroides sp. DW712 TaxID=3389800 RepID=UPI00397AC2F1